MGTQVYDLSKRLDRKNFINNTNSKYSPKNWYIYYRDTLKKYISQYYHINNSYMEELLNNILPNKFETYMFWIECLWWEIYLYISWNKFNISRYIEKFLKEKAKEKILLKL